MTIVNPHQTNSDPLSAVYTPPKPDGYIPNPDGYIPKPIQYKFNEDEILAEIKSYIDSTYSQHYSQEKIQAMEFIMDAGWGEGFCFGSISKYLKRFGKKDGYNRLDLQKCCHYIILAIHDFDQKHSKS